MSGRGGRPPWRWALVAVLLAMTTVAGVITLTLGLVALGAAVPTPSREVPAAAPVAAPAQPPGEASDGGASANGSGQEVRPATPVSLPASTPVSLQIPAIGVDTGVDPLGLNRDDTVQVPTDFDRAGWYTGAPTPGQIGPAVVLGHIDSYRGPAVFYRLDELDPGDVVTVGRADGRRARFSVDSVREYPKDRFPTEDVYGATDTADLRLITCGGPFDPDARSYLHNIVVYAHLTPPAATDVPAP